MARMKLRGPKSSVAATGVEGGLPI